MKNYVMSVIPRPEGQRPYDPREHSRSHRLFERPHEMVNAVELSFGSGFRVSGLAFGACRSGCTLNRGFRGRGPVVAKTYLGTACLFYDSR